MTTKDEAKFMLVEGISLKEYIDNRVAEELVRYSINNIGKYTADRDWIPVNKKI